MCSLVISEFVFMVMKSKTEYSFSSDTFTRLLFYTPAAKSRDIIVPVCVYVCYIFAKNNEMILVKQTFE